MAYYALILRMRMEKYSRRIIAEHLKKLTLLLVSQVPTSGQCILTVKTWIGKVQI
jgi:hypothetical protein